MKNCLRRRGCLSRDRMIFYEGNDLRFNSLELGGPTSGYSHVHARHYTVDPVGPQGQLRNYKDSSGSWIHSADATRRSLWVRKFIKHFHDYEIKLREHSEKKFHVKNFSFAFTINYNLHYTSSYFTWITYLIL